MPSLRRAIQILALCFTLIAGIVDSWSFANGTATIHLPLPSKTLNYDAAGNRSSDARWAYTWDMLDRLTSVVETAPAVAGQALKVEFKYDLLGRRTEKTVSVGAVKQKKVVFQYNGSRLAREIEYSATGAQLAKRTYFWGPDVSGTPEGAAGIGGLLAIHELKGGTLTKNLVLNDGIGNIVGLVDAATGAVKASYEHGMFGEAMDVSGERSGACPLRWQSKYYDEETGFYYFGKRYYDPTTQSWLSRDPEREGGGMNHYAYCENRPIGNSDPLGAAMLVQSETQAVAVADSTWWAMSINGFGPDSNIFGTKSLFVQQGNAWIAELMVRREIEIGRMSGMMLGAGRATFGGAEMIGGLTYTWLSGGVGGFAGGGVVILNGYDNMMAGNRTVVAGGEYSPAWLESQIKSVAGDGMVGNGLYMVTQIGVGAAPIAASRFASLTGDMFLPQAYARGAVLVPDRAAIVGSVELPNTRFVSLGNEVGAVTSPAAKPIATVDDFMAQAQARLNAVKAEYGGVEAYNMAGGIPLKPGVPQIGFMTTDGKLIGNLANASVGHENLALQLGLDTGYGLKPGTVAITIGKRTTGEIDAFGSGKYGPLSDQMKALAKKLGQ